MNFTWTYTGSPVNIAWGIQKDDENNFESNKPILSLDNGGKQTLRNQGYNGRVQTSWSGNSQSGIQVVFTLSAIDINDTNSYLCKLKAGFGDRNKFDDVTLVVEGNVWLV